MLHLGKGSLYKHSGSLHFSINLKITFLSSLDGICMCARVYTPISLWIPEEGTKYVPQSLSALFPPDGDSY